MMRLVIAAVLALAGCSKSDAPPTPARAAAATPAAPAAPSAARDPVAARRLIAAGAVVLDVRTVDEFADGHVPSAVNIPVADVEPRLAEIDHLVGADKTRPVVVYCASGARAAHAKQLLEAAGYTQVVNGGGIDNLQ